MSKNSSNGNGKSLRFAALVRVSTEKQESQGESLSNQKKDCESDVKQMGARIVAWYGGQEHATPGWEKGEVNRLVADAAAGKFDAVLVNKTDRWSRDNAKSEEGVEVFREHGIRFFVRARELDLFNEDDEFTLTLDVAYARRNARSYSRRSLRSRIARAQRGEPTCGKLPFGRKWDARAKVWSIDPDKQKLVQDVAARYLKGEPLPKLAKEKGVNHSNICKVIRERCGETWVQEFHSASLNIHEKITTPVPRLLDEATIKAIGQRLTANRTYAHKPSNLVHHDYLLRGHIFCGSCQYLMTPQENSKGDRYYRHSPRQRERQCSLGFRPYLPADRIEKAVLADLFNLYGNPSAIERAVKQAVPDCDKLLKRREKLDKDLAQIERARTSILGLIEKEALTNAQAATKLTEMAQREAILQEQRGKLNAALADVAEMDRIQKEILEVHEFDHEDGSRTVAILDQEANAYPGGNDVVSFLEMMDKGSDQDRRQLVESAFAAPLPDGNGAGVYVLPTGDQKKRPRQYSYTLKGRVFFSVTRRSLY